MLAVLDVILPILSLSIIGYLLVKVRWFNATHSEVLSEFIFRFSVPVYLFHAMATMRLPDTFPHTILLSYFSAAIAIFVCIFFISQYRLKKPVLNSAVLGFGGSFSNLVLLSIPIIDLAIGPAGHFPLFVVISLHSLILFSITIAAIEISRHRQMPAWKQIVMIPLNTLFSLRSQPFLIGLVLGLLFNFAGLELWDSVDKVMSLIGQTVTPLALFVIGSSMASLADEKHDRHIIWLIGFKLLVHPLLVWFLASQVFHLSEIWTHTLVLMAAMPIGINMLVLARQYQACVKQASSAIFFSTVVSVLTISVLLYGKNAGVW